MDSKTLIRQIVAEAVARAELGIAASYEEADQFISARVAYRYMMAMPKPPTTREEAAGLLGIDLGKLDEISSADDREDVVEKAYRGKAFEHHPDRGGDPDRMVEVNVARDILVGKRSPKPEFPVHDPGVVVRRRGPMKETKVTFQEALAKAHVPSDVKWIFASNTGYGGYGDAHTSATVFYGTTDTQHIFLGVHYNRDSNMFENWKREEYTCFLDSSPISSSISEVAPRKIREMFNRFSGLRKGYNAKVTILPQGFQLTEREATFPNGKTMSFKDAMVNLGLVGDEHRWKTKQKLKIVLIYHRKGFGKEEEVNLELDINGRTFELNRDSVKMMLQGHERALRAIFGTYYYDGSKKELTRIKGAKTVLTQMAEAFKTEPQELQDLLTQAAEQVK
jgi:hypothetical protein